jgi:DNA polymerase-4
MAKESLDTIGTHVEWLFLDLNSYFASVEQQEYPDLRGEPIAVVPMPTDATCAIAASYEAKAYGVKTGTKIFEAKRLCPTLKCALARHDVYVEYHEKIMAEIVKHTPLTKIWSIDECSSRLTSEHQPIEKAIALARRIKEGIWENVGAHINCSIGLSCNSLLAKISAEMNKPDGLTVLAQEDLPGKLLKCDLTDLPGIGENMERRLNRAGIWSVEHLYNLAPKQARRIWGSVQGERFWYQLHGHDIPGQETQTRIFGHSRMLDPDIRSPEQAKQMARRLTIKAVQRMRRKQFYAKTFSLSVRLIDGQRWAYEIKGHAANDSMTFIKALDALWALMMRDMRPHLLKKVSVTLHNLQHEEGLNYDLFDHSIHSWQKMQEQRQKISSVIEDLNRKHGRDAVTIGISPKTIAGFVGTKIAFSRVPEKEEFLE